MRRPVQLATMLILVGTAASARASDHLMRINEVVVSANGTNTVQFVELHDVATDTSTETFPALEYSVEVFDVDGVSLGETIVDPPSGTEKMLLATAAAETFFSVDAD